MTADVIVFKGIKYRRYPEAKNWAERSYYTPGIADRQHGRRRLHEDLWIDAYGPIPPGYHVHHRDHDTLNNDLDNLICIPRGEHQQHHKDSRRGVECTPEQLAHLAKIRDLAAEWHRSPEGREWHVEHGRRTWDGRPHVERTCEHCGIDYLTRVFGGHERFCSNACKSAARRASGVDNVDKLCVVCGSVFTANRYARAVTCSRKCGMTMQWDKRRSRA